MTEPAGYPGFLGYPAVDDAPNPSPEPSHDN
jgi:hypothetical protein